MNKSHSLRKHPLYSIWSNMKTRVFNPKTHNYSNYGGKGITICREWVNDFKCFYEWCMSNGYKPGLTLDRKDSCVGYNPDNCRWTSVLIQQRNKSKYRNGKCKYIGVSPQKWSGKIHYLSGIRVMGNYIYLGSFTSQVKAAKARDKYIIDNNLTGYRLNFI